MLAYTYVEQEIQPPPPSPHGKPELICVVL